MSTAEDTQPRYVGTCELCGRPVQAHDVAYAFEEFETKDGYVFGKRRVPGRLRHEECVTLPPHAVPQG